MQHFSQIVPRVCTSVLFILIVVDQSVLHLCGLKPILNHHIVPLCCLKISVVPLSTCSLKLIEQSAVPLRSLNTIDHSLAPDGGSCPISGWD